MVYIYRTPIDEHRRQNHSVAALPSGRSLFSSSKSAAAQSTPKMEYPSSISFSCMICIEDFDETERPPMVLPCGHTYVCLPCTKQLTKCMECRQSLFVDPPEATISREAVPPHPSPARPLTLQQMRNMRRTATTNASSSMNPKTPNLNSTPQKKSRTPLPIPKNVVLLALMEAKQQNEAPQEALARSPTPSQQKVVTPPPPRRSPALGGSFALLEEKKDDDRLIEPTSAVERRLQRHHRRHHSVGASSTTKGSPVLVSSGLIRSDRSEPGIEVAQDFMSARGDDLVSMDDRTVDYFESEHRRTCMDALLARRHRPSPKLSDRHSQQHKHQRPPSSQSYRPSNHQDPHKSPLLHSDSDHQGEDSFNMARAKQGGYRLQMNSVQLHPI